jgi:hypothetical protein
MAETKTKATEVDPEDFIAAVPDPQRRADAEKLTAMMERLSGEPPKMWGPSIIGFGDYTYKYDSGHGGTSARAAFSPRAKELVLYLSSDGYAGKEDQLARLGKHRIGKACLYIKKLSDVDEAVLEEMISDSIAWMDEKYPRGS